MPNLYTFSIIPIKKLLAEELDGGHYVDPFAGKNSPAQETNDIRDEMPTKFHMDALDFLRGFKTASIDGILYDPPYSITQARNYGKKEFASMKYWKQCKDESARILGVGGKALCFGWSSQGLGKGRGFTMTRVLLVPHDGSKNDTIVTVEHKESGQ